MTASARHDETTRSTASRCRRAAAAALAGVLMGCGGGGGYVDNSAYLGPPPDISLAVAPTVAERGEAVQLAGAVSAANGVDFVEFYRIDFGTPVLLGAVVQPPANWITAVPINAGRSVAYFARVHDLAGYYADSAVVTVAVFP